VDGVRNFQARNMLRDRSPGDRVSLPFQLRVPGIVAVMQIVKQG